MGFQLFPQVDFLTMSCLLFHFLQLFYNILNSSILCPAVLKLSLKLKKNGKKLFVNCILILFLSIIVVL